MDSSEYENKNPGGFVNPHHTKPRTQKIRWNADNDRKLLLIGQGREISPKEYKPIAEKIFSKEQPTPKAVQERLTKLRQEQKVYLEKIGVTGPIATLHPVRPEDNHDHDDQTTTTPDKAKSDAAKALLGVADNTVVDDDEEQDMLVSKSTTTGKKRPAKQSEKPNKKARNSTGASSFSTRYPPTEPTETAEESRARRHAEARAGEKEQKDKEKSEKAAEKLKKSVEDEE